MQRIAIYVMSAFAGIGIGIANPLFSAAALTLRRFCPGLREAARKRDQSGNVSGNAARITNSIYNRILRTVIYFQEAH